jgi:glycosyltransferase involved in cell wall biosynthesis
VTSEHEGFCVPLVEAMALGVPTVAVPAAAVPETAGRFAKYAEPTPQMLAEAIRELIADGPSRERHLNEGAQRYRECFAPASISLRFLDLVQKL